MRILLALALVSAAAAAQPPLNIRGLQPGDPGKAFESMFQGHYCHTTRSGLADETCAAAKQTYAEQDAQYFATVIDDRIVTLSVHFSPSDFDTIELALVAKFGQPTKRTSNPVKTRAGAEFLNTTLIWTSPTATMTALRYGDSIDAGMVLLEASDSAVQRRNMQARRLPARLKDM